MLVSQAKENDIIYMARCYRNKYTVERLTVVQAYPDFILCSNDGGKGHTVCTENQFKQLFDNKEEAHKYNEETKTQNIKDHLHVLEGVKIITQNITKTVEIVCGSKDEHCAKKALIKAFNLSEIQADIIIKMRLTQFNIKKINNKYENLQSDLQAMNDRSPGKHRVI